MKYEFTREHMMPVVMELTYEDLLLIQKMAKLVIDMETSPDGIYKGDARKMDQEVTEAIDKMAQAVKYFLPSPKE